jgi:two-component sensor histidine kinase
MALVHEVLYRSGNLAAIDFPDYADRLVKYLLPSYGAVSDRVRVELRMDPLSVDTDAAIPCGLILTELLTNALKHAFPDGRSGTIVVALDRGQDGDHWLVVRDDGIGIPPELSADNASTLGWRLVRSLTRQVEGTFAITRTNPGTEAALRFSARKV